MAHVKISDRDHGAKKLLEQLRKGRLSVGILEAKFGEEHEGSTSTIGEIATAHELGLGVPRRSFLADWVSAREPEARATLAKLEARVVKQELTQDQALELFGQWVQGSIQVRISENIPPPLAPETIARKGSSVALIDKGQLRGAISYRVEPAA